ncbi:hypothetical protein DRQ18_06570 [bacterium]|nr:MAG: hypothetical protein DRQ18_06570 [bacterium]
MIGLVFIFLFGELEKSTALINVPTAYVGERGLEFRMFGNLEILGENKVHPFDYQFVLGYHNPPFEAYLTMYTLTTYSLDVKYQFSKNIAFGVDHITYNPWISPVGMGKSVGFVDDVQYEKVGGRPPELFSLYGVYTRKLFPFFEVSVGLGRGKFVGYGPLSHYFNSDILFASTQEELREKSHPAWAFGLFFGGKITILPTLYFAFEFDGRNGNVGAFWDTPLYQIAIAFTRLEQLRPPKALLNPRFMFGGGIKLPGFGREKRMGVIAGKVSDVKTGQPLVAKITIIKEATKKKLKPFYSSAMGVFRVRLPEGRYIIHCEADNYEPKRYRVRVIRDKVIRLNVMLKRKLTQEELLAEKYAREGIDFFNKGEYVKARERFKKALSYNPSNALATDYLKKTELAIDKLVEDLKNKAIAMERRDPKGAIELWKKVLYYRPGHKEALDRIKALQALLAPKKPAPRKPAAKPSKPKPAPKKLSKAEINKLYRNGVELYMKGKYAEAVKIFEEVLKHDPNHKGAKKFLKKAKSKL